MEPTNRRRVVRALEVTLGSGRPFSSFGPGLDDLPADAVPPRRAALAAATGRRPRASRRASTPAGRRLPRRGRARLAARPDGPVAHRRARRSATGSCSPTSTASCRSTRPSTLAVAPHPPLRPPPASAGSGATPASPGSTPSDDPLASTSPTPCWETEPRMRSPSTTAWATTSSSLLDLDGTARRSTADAGRARCATATAASAPTGCSGVTAGTTATPTSTMDAVQRRRQPGRDERQRHPLPGPGRGRTAGPATRPTLRVATDAGLRARRRRRRPTTRAPSWPASTWARPGRRRRAASWARRRTIAARRPRRRRQPAPRRCARRRRAPTVDLVAARAAIDASPGGINVEVVAAGPGADELTMRVYERGVGITEACGTGACAAAAAAARAGGSSATRVDGAHAGRRRATSTVGEPRSR